MNIFYDRDEWDDGTYGPAWEDEGGPPSEEEDVSVSVMIPQAEIYIEIHDGLPWGDNCIRTSD